MQFITYCRLKEKYPSSFFHFFEKDFNQNLLFQICDFYELRKDQQWIKDSTALMNIRDKKQTFEEENINYYKDRVNTLFSNYPEFKNNLLEYAK